MGFILGFISCFVLLMVISLIIDWRDRRFLRKYRAEQRKRRGGGLSL